MHIVNELALAGAAVLSATAALAALPESIPIGHIADYSGPTSDVGTPYSQSVDDAIAWGENIRQGMYARQNWVPKGAEGVCKASRWTAEDHRGMLQVELYRAQVKGTTDGQISDLIAHGSIKLARVATIDLPRKKEWLGW